MNTIIFRTFTTIFLNFFWIFLDLFGILKFKNVIFYRTLTRLLMWWENDVYMCRHMAISQAFNEDRTTSVTQRWNSMWWHSFIWALHLPSDIRDLVMTFHILAFHVSHWSKMKGQILQPHPSFVYIYSLSSIKNVFLKVSTSQSLNHLLYSSFRFISTSKEWLKGRFRKKNREISPLKCRNSFLKRWKALDPTIN